MSATTQSVVTPEFVFAYRELILSNMVAESQTNKKVISAISEARRSYRPDPKARSAYELAWHIAYEEVFLLNSIADLKIEMPPKVDPPGSIAGILKWYDENLPKAVARVRNMTPQQLLTPVDFFGLMKLPVFQYLLLVNSHSIHHRGQLSTYLRPMGSMVPGIYGPSADVPL